MSFAHSRQSRLPHTADGVCWVAQQAAGIILCVAGQAGIVCFVTWQTMLVVSHRRQFSYPIADNVYHVSQDTMSAVSCCRLRPLADTSCPLRRTADIVCGLLCHTAGIVRCVRQQTMSAVSHRGQFLSARGQTRNCSVSSSRPRANT